MSDGKTGLQLRSLIKKSGELEISLVDVPTPEPAADEVVVRVEAAPINPSDLGLLVGAADMSTAKASGSKDAPVITAKVPEGAMRAMAGRLDEAMPVGNEGAGVVIKTGSSDAAKALMGKTVAMIGGAMYAQYRCTPHVRECLPLPDGHHAGRRRLLLRQSAHGARHDRDHAARGAQGAGAHRRRLQSRADAEQDLHQGRHPAGQHRAQQRAGRHRCADRCQIRRRFHRPSFLGDLTNALVETGATSPSMPSAAASSPATSSLHGSRDDPTATAYSRYGSNVHKQVYVYGALEIRRPSSPRGFGMAWGVGGWLLFPFLMKIGQADGARLRQRVVDELKTTFASHYTKVVSLQEALDPANIAVYAKRATGEKFLINPNKSS